MKHTVSVRIMRRLSAALLVLLLLLVGGAGIFVTNTVTERNQKYSRALNSIYGDLIVFASEQKGVPLDVEHPEECIFYGQYFCQWYDVSYVYVYVPDFETETATFIAILHNDKKAGVSAGDNYNGYQLTRPFAPEELAVWSGEQDFAFLRRDNEFGSEYCTLHCVTDSFGNRVIVGLDIDNTEVFRHIFSVFALMALVILLVLVGINLVVYFIIRRRVTLPAETIRQSMNDFVTGGTHTPVEIDAADSDEFSEIAAAFNNMAERIDSYVENIRTLTRQQEYQNAELDIASAIQRGILPDRYLCRDSYELRAMMEPAKDVGGDLYDYLPLDDDRVLLVIADVSGKGIPAAMFMLVTLTLIRQFARMGLSPAEILRRTNSTLSENNSAMLFTTALVGIYDDRTGEFTYSNAGHNLPYVLGSSLRVLDGAKGTLIGLFPDEDYTQTTVKLETGDTLLLYTDGVTEAVNGKREFFGTQRLEAALEAFRAAHGEDAVAFLYDAVRGFADGAEPFDDLTMLTLTARRTRTLELDCELRELERIKAELLALPLPRKQQLSMCLAAEEVFVNICSYAFPDGVPAGEKILFSVIESDRVSIRFADGGRPFDPLERVEQPEDYDPDTQLGGLGRFIGFAGTDERKYEYKDGKNVLTVTFYFEEETT